MFISLFLLLLGAISTSLSLPTIFSLQRELHDLHRVKRQTPATVEDGAGDYSSLLTDYSSSRVGLSEDYAGDQADLTQLAISTECHNWLTCSDPLRDSYWETKVSQLPTCPCEFPEHVYVNDQLMVADPWKNNHTFRWSFSLDALEENGNVFRRVEYGARYCIRSHRMLDPTNMAAQVCCYGDDKLLITRGGGAGYPEMIHPGIDLQAHRDLDIMPWILCKGDWSVMHRKHAPNNERGCTQLPPDAIYQTQLASAKI